ncbi:hypothetical protein [Mycoplasmopsis cricetuli]|uniref:hypothetical protein n=1 Tax=Mycoplasmopsis cricetuli TaxID=171283 RepID=UPI0004721E1A|nr:hypothetical protein [Mycoplasmopsis cricetuli]
MKKNSWVWSGKITEINKDRIIVKDYKNQKFYIDFLNITDNWKLKLKNIFKLKENINFYVLSFDESKKEGIGSFKLNHPNFAKNPFSYKLKATPSGFDNLKKFTLDDIEDINENTKD